jgi:hypothetical protein
VLQLSENVKAPIAAGEMETVTAVTLLVEDEGNASAPADTWSDGVESPTGQSGSGMRVTVFVVPAGSRHETTWASKRQNLAEDTYLMAMGRPRVMQVWSDELGVRVPVFFVVARRVHILAEPTLSKPHADMAKF